MKKVLKFVTGRKDDKKDNLSTNVGPFSLELSIPSRQVTPNEEDHIAAAQEQGYAYKIDLSGKDKSISKLHKAAWQGNLEKLKVNLKKTDIDIPDRYNRTPLHLAASQGHCNVVWFLIANNANMNICDNEGKTPLLKAIECGQTDTVRLMLERGAEINIVDYNGNSGLHLAAKHGFYEIASMLLKRGANEDSNNMGEFPLHIATQHEHKDLIELLLRYGSCVNVVDRENRSPLMLAAKSGRMPVVQLFLEYGAQRAVMDSNDWTAEDYALFSGHEDIAAELKTPSEVLVLPFSQRSLESEKKVIANITTAAKRSASAVSLQPVPTKEKDANTSRSKTDDAENSDTWNDSQVSEQSLMQKGLKLGRFLQRPSEDDGSEVSGGSPQVIGEDTQDSPRSCVIPPPCKPPRSWDLIQSGVMDDHSQGSEPRRRSLLTLGSLRSKRESFGDSQNGVGSPEQQLSHCLCGEDASTPNKESSSTKYGEIQVKTIGPNRSATMDRQKLNVSGSDSDWSSDDSLPLDSVDKIDSNALPQSSCFQPQSRGASNNNEQFDFSNAPTLEKRGRFLLRAPSIDLTDDDFDSSRDKSVRSNASSEHMVTDAGVTLPTAERKNVSSQSGSLGRDEAMLGYDEMWEANAQLPCLLTSSGTQIFVKDELEASSDRATHSEEMLNVIPSDNSRLMATAIHLEEDQLLYPSPGFGQKMEDETETITNVSQVERKLESKSLDAVGESMDHFARGTEVRAQHGKKKHARQQSMSIHSWSRSEESQQKPLETVPAPAPLPPQFERPTIDSKRISAQLECYDEALRELAQVKLIKKQGPSSLPPTRGGSELALGPNDFTGRELAQAAIVRKQGSLSLPRNVDPPTLERASSLGTQGPSNFLFSGNFPAKELAHSAIIKKQGSLSLPRTSEVPDLMKAQSVDVSKEGYLSLPRSNELIDQVFKEIGKTSVKMKRGSRSLPRNITPGDMNMHGDGASVQRSKKVFRARRRAESESEATDKKSKRSLKCLSFEFKLRSSKSEEPKSLTPKSQEEVDLTRDSKPSPKSISPKPVENLAVMPKSNIEKPSIRKKRKILLAMRGLIAPNLKSFSDSVTHNEGSVENSSIDEHPFWLSTDRTGGLERQSTVIERTEFQSVTDTSLKEIERTGESPTHLEERIEEEDHLSPGSEEHRIIHEALKCLPPAVMPTKSLNSSENGLTCKEEDMIHPKDVSEARGKKPVAANDDASVDKISSASQDSVKESSTVPMKGLTKLTEVNENGLSPEEGAVPNSLQAEVTLHVVPDYPPPPDLERMVLLENIPEVVSSGTENRESKSTSQPSSVLTDFFEEQRSPLNMRDTPSDADSGASLNEITPQHEYTLKAHQVLLRNHLRAATEEKGRLEETAAELGERAEQLQYELYEAREAARGRDEVIAVLQDQLVGLEARYTCALDQLQQCRLRAANLDQELRHLNDICRKHEEEKAQLKNMLQLKESEKINFEKSLAVKESAKLQAAKAELQQEWQDRVRLLEEDKKGLLAEKMQLQGALSETEAKLQDIIRRNTELAKEKAELGIQLGVEMASVREECNKWQKMYEGTTQRLQPCGCGQEASLATRVPPVETCSSCGGIRCMDRLSEVHLLASAYKEELKNILEKVEGLKEKDSTTWQHKIQEEVSSAVAVLRCEYDKVESILCRHNDTLEQLVGKLQSDLEEAVQRQAETDAELSQARVELVEARQLSEELAHLREVSGAIDKMRVMNGELKVQLGKVEDKLFQRDNELRMKTEHLVRLEHLVAEQARALERADNLHRRRSRSFDSVRHTYGRDLVDAFAQTSDIPILLLPPDDESAETVRLKHMPRKKELTDTASQTHDILVISSDGNEEPFDYLQDEERLISSEELVIRLRKENEELQDILEHKTDQLKQMVDKTKSLVKHNDRMKTQLNELKSKHSVAAEKSDKEILTDECFGRGIGQECTAVPCTYKDDCDKNGDNATSKGHCLVEENLVDKLRKENKSLRDALNQLLAETGIEIERQGDHSAPVTVCMVLGGPPLSQDPQQLARLTKDSGPWSCNAQKANRVICSDSKGCADENPNGECILRSSSCCEVANCREVYKCSGVGLYEKERHKNRESKELSSPVDSLSDEAPSNVIEVQVSVHRDGDVDSAPSKPCSSPSSSGDELDCRKMHRCASFPSRSRLARDAATNTIPPTQNLELQKELQAERERSKKYQQSVRRLKSEVQTLRIKTGEGRKISQIGTNLNNSSILAALTSPTHHDQGVYELRNQVAELAQKLKEENSKRFGLEVQVNKMRYELQEKSQLERELATLHNRLEKDFVSRHELDCLHHSYEAALNHARKEAEMLARDELNRKMEEQTRLAQLRHSAESQVRQEVEEMRTKFQSEMARAQARECDDHEHRDQQQEAHRRRLIEKSYSLNFAPAHGMKDKEINSKSSVLEVRSAGIRPPMVQPLVAPIIAISSPDNSLSHILRRELEKSIRKSTEVVMDQACTSNQSAATDEHMERLRKKYFLH